MTNAEKPRLLNGRYTFKALTDGDDGILTSDSAPTFDEALAKRMFPGIAAHEYLDAEIYAAQAAEALGVDLDELEYVDARSNSWVSFTLKEPHPTGEYLSIRVQGDIASPAVFYDDWIDENGIRRIGLHRADGPASNTGGESREYIHHVPTNPTTTRKPLLT